MELLFEIQSELIKERYRPPAVRRVLIPKPGKKGAKRPLGIPTVKDRIVQTATKLVIEHLFEASFLDCSFGFRQKKNPHQTHAQIQRFVIGGYREVVDVDLKSYFTMIPHERLMLCVKKRVRDPKVLRLIKRWLKAGILDKGRYVRTDEGVPQGGPLKATV